MSMKQSVQALLTLDQEFEREERLAREESMERIKKRHLHLEEVIAELKRTLSQTISVTPKNDLAKMSEEAALAQAIEKEQMTAKELLKDRSKSAIAIIKQLFPVSK